MPPIHTAKHAPQSVLSELAAKVGAAGTRLPRVLDKIASDDMPLFTEMCEHIRSCDEYTITIWTNWFDNVGSGLMQRKPYLVPKEARQDFPGIRVLTALRPYEAEFLTNGPGSTSTMTINRLWEVFMVYSASFRYAGSEPVPERLFEPLALATFIKAAITAREHINTTEAMVSQVLERPAIELISAHFDQVMARAYDLRDLLAGRGKLDPQLIQELLQEGLPAPLAAGAL